MFPLRFTQAYESKSVAASVASKNHKLRLDSCETTLCLALTQEDCLTDERGAQFLSPRQNVSNCITEFKQWIYSSW